MTVGLPEIWSKFKIEIAASDQSGSYRKKQKYLMQFHSFIKEIEIIGRDPERLFHSNIPTRSGISRFSNSCPPNSDMVNIYETSVHTVVVARCW